MADYPIAELGGKTPLQVAHKPNIDSIAAKGRCGLIKNVPDDMHPGSETAILSLLGYDPHLYCTGRGPLEAPARGITLAPNDVAYRCNLVTEQNGTLIDYSAGHVTTPEAQQLIAAVKEAFEQSGKLEFFSGLDYRHFLIVRNFPYCRDIICNPPHDVIGSLIADVLPQAKTAQAEPMAALLREKILQSKAILEQYPVNVARAKAGKRPANMIWPWGGGPKPSMPSFQQKYGLKAAVISAVDLVKGIGAYADMTVLKVEGATGLANTNYEGKADAALAALESHDLVFVHVEAPDEAGHVKDIDLKVKTIEDLDRRMLGHILQHLKEPCAVAVLPDHPTPIKVGTHTRDPVPFAIYNPTIKADPVTKFDEDSVKTGSYGLVTEQSLMALFTACCKTANF